MISSKVPAVMIKKNIGFIIAEYFLEKYYL